MKVITIREHWASAIFDQGKDVENRTWKTQHRGNLLIHAGSSKALLKVSKECIEEISSNTIKAPKLGCIIGKVTLVDCVTNSQSDWAVEDCYHWILSNPIRCNPYPITGKLSLWDFDHNLIDWNY